MLWWEVRERKRVKKRVNKKEAKGQDFCTPQERVLRMQNSHAYPFTGLL